jgi:AcrR family transcriptional regulator
MSGTLRADARANRDQVLAAARELFSTQGADVSMKDIADRAGVGVGTLYRRFPDRDALISATAEAHLSDLAAALESARRGERTAWFALRRFVRACINGGIGALAAAIEPGLHARMRQDAQVKAARAAIRDTLAELTRQAQADGDLRPDATPDDIALLMTVQVYLRPDQSHSEATERVADLIFDGLRA